MFRFLGLSFIEPELREDTGEVEKALESKLPKLLEIKDIYYVGNIKTQAFRAFKLLNKNSLLSKFQLNKQCEKLAFSFAGDLSSKIASELRSINIDRDKKENIKKIEEIFNKYIKDYSIELKQTKL